MRRRWVWLAAVALVALSLVLRIAYVNATPDYVARHDARDYDVHAISIAEGQGFSKTIAYDRATAFRPPGYPYFLGAVYHLFNVERAANQDRWRVARIAQAFVGAAVVALVGVLAVQLWGSIAALVAMALTAIYVPLITVGGAIMSEPLYDVFMLASLAAALAHRRSSHRYRWALLAGVLAGLATLTRAQAMILLVPLAIAVWDGRPWRSRAAIGPPLVLLVAAALTIAPWTIRNARELHAFVPVSTQLGSALAGTYNDSARADTQNPAAWQGLKHVPDYAYLFRRVREIPEATLDPRRRSRRTCEPPRCATSARTRSTSRRSAGGTRAACSTSPGNGARARPRRRSRSTTRGPTAASCASGSSARWRWPRRSPAWRAEHPGSCGPSRP